MALALGRTINELNVDSRELGEWMAFYKIEPFGSERDNLHAALIAATVAASAPFRNGRAPAVEDFMFSDRGQSEQMSDTEIERTARAIKAMHNSYFLGE